jgi:tetratricopeptide (TPR) repeat protein
VSKNLNNKTKRMKKILTFIIIAALSSGLIYAQDENNLNIAYNLLNTGQTNQAISIFENHIKDYPVDFQIYLQLGYAYKQIGNVVKAREYFTFVSTKSNDKEQIASAKKELEFLSEEYLTKKMENDELNKGYEFVNNKNYGNAVKVFETYKSKHPYDYKIYMQLGYLYTDMSNYDKAIENFNYVKSYSKSIEQIDDATVAIYYLRDMNIIKSKNSLSVYLYNVYDSHFENNVSNIIGHYYYKLYKNLYTGIYGDAYLDTRTKPALIYNDRYIEGGGFVNYRFTDNIGVEFRAGFVREIDFNKNSFNFKPILYAGTRIGSPSIYFGSKNTKREFFYFDVYSVGLYDYKFRNFFGQAITKEVLRTMTGGFSFIEFYLSQMALIDSKQFNYNNYAEYGAGVSFKPDIPEFPSIFLEATNKTFFIGDNGLFWKGKLTNTFQVKAGLLFNLNLKL